MLKNQRVCLGIVAVLLPCSHSTLAQVGPASGLYQITAGRYEECCGIAGSPFGDDLPNAAQSFVGFTIDAQTKLATLSFLAADAQTVFGAASCPPDGPIQFSFEGGMVLPDWTWFHVDPGPPPEAMYWSYTVSNSANCLRIDGTLVTLSSGCADWPTHYSHSNVVAVLVPGPRLTVLEISKEQGTRLMVQGNAGWTDVVAVSTDLAGWTPISTNWMDYSLCPTCPFVIVQDAASTNSAQRFYRAFEFP